VHNNASAFDVPRATRRLEHDLVGPGCAGVSQGFLVVAGDRLRYLLGKDLGGGLSQDRFARDAQQLFVGSVGEGITKVAGVLDQDRDWDVLDDRVEELLRGANLRFRAVAFRHVDDRAKHGRLTLVCQPA
jgi:hypothetical protein